MNNVNFQTKRNKIIGQIYKQINSQFKYNNSEFVGNKAKERISKWVFQENKAC